jgi:hypothetical protein
MNDQQAILDKFKSIASEYEHSQLDIIMKAEIDCMKAYQAENKSSLLNDWTAARTAKDRLISELEKKYSDAPPAYKTLKDAHEFLVDQGYKCKKSKIYKDKDAGKIRLQPDGSVLESEIFAYMSGLKKVRGSGNGGELDNLHIEKAKAELQKTLTAEERLRFDLDKERGKYLLRDDVIREIILKIAAIEAGVKHLIRINAVDYIQKVGGHPEKSAMFIELLESELDELWTGFCEFDELNIIVRPKTEEVDRW